MVSFFKIIGLELKKVWKRREVNSSVMIITRPHFLITVFLDQIPQKASVSQKYIQISKVSGSTPSFRSDNRGPKGSVPITVFRAST
jgi:hypothetical protein